MENTFCKQIDAFAKSFNTKMRIEKKSKNTIEAYSRTYRDFILFCQQHYKELTFKNIREEDIYAFIEYKSDTMQKQGDLSVSSTNAIISHLKRLFKHIERNSDELYDFDKVFQDIKLKQPKRVPKGLTEKEVEKLLNYLEKMKSADTFIAIRNVTLIKIILFGGLRASEAVSIKLSNIELQNGLYKISFKGKGDKNRVTYIHQELLEDELTTLQQDHKLQNDEYIAKTSGENRMDRIQLSKMINSVFVRAGLQPKGIHILRHTAAKRLLSKGVSIVVVQSILGHSSIQTTSIYANPTEDIVRREIASKNIKNNEKNL